MLIIKNKTKTFYLKKNTLILKLNSNLQNRHITKQIKIYTYLRIF